MNDYNDNQILNSPSKKLKSQLKFENFKNTNKMYRVFYFLDDNNDAYLDFLIELPV